MSVETDFLKTLKKTLFQISELAQHIKVLATKPKDPGSILLIHGRVFDACKFS